MEQAVAAVDASTSHRASPVERPQNMNWQGSNREPPIFFHLKLVAKIALSIGVAAGAGLMVVLHLLKKDGVVYGQVISEYSLAQQQLGPALLVLGLMGVAFAGVTTWLIALHSSFRIAGPLFRFARNLELEIKQGPTALVPIRGTDQLQNEWQEFNASVTVLGGHHAALRAAIRDVAQSLQDPADPAVIKQALDQLQKIERRASL
jgi:hypothetical protein